MSAEDIFSGLGFNALEAEVYVALLKHGPQTAYKIGKLLNRPTANVYKAVDALASNGAIQVQEDDVKVCSAIPIKSLARQLQQSYQDKLDRAVTELNSIKPEPTDEGIYKLHTVESVFQRADEMLKRCRKIVVVDAFPAALERIRPTLSQLAKKGVEVFVEAYAPVKPEKGISVVIPTVSAESLKEWNAQQLNIVADSRELLAALFNDSLTDLVQATYSNNLYLSCLLHSGLLNEHHVHGFMGASNMKEVNELKKNMRYLYNANAPGLEQLFSLYKKKKS